MILPLALPLSISASATPLREQEGTGLVARLVCAQVLPQVKSRLSSRGCNIRPILLAVNAWRGGNISRFGEPKGLRSREG